MKLKPAIHRAVCRWAAKRTLPKKNGVEPQAERKSSAPDYVARSGEHIRRTDRMLADFVHERYDLRFNVLDSSTELKRKEEPEEKFRTISERESNTVCLEAHSAGIPCWDRDLLRFIHSSHVEAYHPFRQYFDRLPDWDGTDRLEALAMRVSSDPVWVSAFRRWMLGVAAQWSGRTDGMHVCGPVAGKRQAGTGKVHILQGPAPTRAPPLLHRRRGFPTEELLRSCFRAPRPDEEGRLYSLTDMLSRILGVTGVIAAVIFCFKDKTWQLLLAPSEWDFVTYRWIEQGVRNMGFSDFRFAEYHVELIATDLSSQFMTHITTAVYLGLLGASPYVLYELFRFISSALYENERRYSVQVVVIVYVLFLLGVLMSYYVLFPISFRFLGTYSVAERVHSTITLDSYVSTFTTLTLVMGAVFQLPVIAFALAKMGLISSSLLSCYRRHALLVIMLVAAIITPPDIMTLTLVTIPLYLLYEVSIRVVRWV